MFEAFTRTEMKGIVERRPIHRASLSHQLSELHATRDLLAIFVPLHYAKFLHQGGAYGEESIRRWQKYNTRYGIIREEVGKHVVRSSDGVAAVSASTYVCRRYCLFRGL